MPCRIWLDPDKVAAHDLSASQVLDALRAQNLQVAAGVLNRPPVPVPTAAAYQIGVEARGRLATPEEFGDIVIKSDGAGRVTRVRDVGRVEVGAADYGEQRVRPIITTDFPCSFSRSQAQIHSRSTKKSSRRCAY